MVNNKLFQIEVRIIRHQKEVICDQYVWVRIGTDAGSDWTTLRVPVHPRGAGWCAQFVQCRNRTGLFKQRRRQTFLNISGQYFVLRVNKNVRVFVFKFYVIKANCLFKCKLWRKIGYIFVVNDDSAAHRGLDMLFLPPVGGVMNGCGEKKKGTELLRKSYCVLFIPTPPSPTFSCAIDNRCPLYTSLTDTVGYYLSWWLVRNHVNYWHHHHHTSRWVQHNVYCIYCIIKQT